MENYKDKLEEMRREGDKDKQDLNNQIAELQKMMQAQREESEQNKKKDQTDFERKLKERDQDLEKTRAEQAREKDDWMKGCPIKSHV